MKRTILLGCGLVSSAIYVAADVVASLRYPGYSYTDQAVSELLAEDAPTRQFIVSLIGVPYNVLVTAFATGVTITARPERQARLTGPLLAGYAVAGAAGGLIFNMDKRSVLVAGGVPARAGNRGHVDLPDRGHDRRF